MAGKQLTTGQAPFFVRILNAAAGSRGRFKGWSSRLAVFFALAAIACGFATYAALTEAPPFGNDPNIVIWLLNVDLVVLLGLVALIARRIVALWSGRKRGLAGSHLQVKLVYIFSFLAAAPVIIMTVFSAFFFHFGVQTWFSHRVQTAVNESLAVAEAYLDEHQQVIRADTLAMANDLDRQVALLTGNQQAFDEVMQTQSVLRNLSEAIVFDSEGRILARSSLAFSLAFEALPTYAMREAADGEVVLMTGGNDDRVRALVKLSNFIDAYLFVGRMVDQKVLSHVTSTRAAVEDYADLQARYSGLQVTVTMIFVVVGLLLLLAAIWFGLVLARQLVSPISSLITAADRVRAGDLTARVPEADTLEEFDYLARSFNRMTSQIQEQQTELIAANRQLDQRRRFTEAVLAGVSSGVIGVDENGVVTVCNNSACELLHKNAADLSGRKLIGIFPEFTELMKAAQKRPRKTSQAEIPLTGIDGGRKTLLVRVAVEMAGEDTKGAVITFDDITELQSAQRKAAWADIARRIAHEIKNPLTPIQLSAERLRRKYLGQISEGQDSFAECTDTIIKHVGDIGHMVDEFSSFARMPEPVIKRDNLGAHIREALVLQKQAHPGIEFIQTGFDVDYVASFDAAQIRQAVTNLVQNAIDSIQSRIEKDKERGVTPQKGKIAITIAPRAADEAAVIVSDNGLGLPKTDNLASLTEPYVTHKAKGTGLGLAIVKKIMEDHGGEIVLGTPAWLKSVSGWEDACGATVALVLPIENQNAMMRVAS